MVKTTGLCAGRAGWITATTSPSACSRQATSTSGAGWERWPVPARSWSTCTPVSATTRCRYWSTPGSITSTAASGIRTPCGRSSRTLRAMGWPGAAPYTSVIIESLRPNWKGLPTASSSVCCRRLVTGTASLWMLSVPPGACYTSTVLQRPEITPPGSLTSLGRCVR